jgi:hypothetical protein
MSARPRIDDKVTAAHVDHFCPGASGFPVTSPHSVGLSLEDAFVREPPPLASHPQAGAGQPCDRCQQSLAAGQQVRRRASGAWVHESCPHPPLPPGVPPVPGADSSQTPAREESRGIKAGIIT